MYMKDKALLEQAHSYCEMAIWEHGLMEDYLRASSEGPEHAQMEFTYLIDLCLILEKLLRYEKE